MNYKLATSRPAQAVGYQAQGLGSDGDGGETAGVPSVGVGAADALGNQSCENPLPGCVPWSRPGPNHYPVPPSVFGRAQHAGQSGGLGNPSIRLAPAAKSAPVRLKPRTFRFGTWNMNGWVWLSPEKKKLAKSPFAEGLLHLEKLDVLILTETHSTSFSHSRSVSLLCESGLNNLQAGIAILTKAGSGWSCTDSRVLIPGYSVLVQLHNKRSTESLWLLCVYGDTSYSGSLPSFYRKLKFALSAAVSSIPNWSGCFAAGDWNFVRHPEDRSPAGRDLPPSRLIRDFDSILSFCDMQDVVGPGPSPRGFSFRGVNRGSPALSHIDRLYCPLTSWFPGSPVTIPVLWSDHSLVWSECVLSRPKVQMAVPADRLPPSHRLDDKFWSDVLESYSTLTSSPVSLVSWSSFKSRVLSLGLSSKNRSGSMYQKSWMDAFRRSELSPDDFDAAVRWLCYEKRPVRRPPVPRRWPSAIPSMVVPPLPVRPSWSPTPNTPFTASTSVRLIPVRPYPALASTSPGPSIAPPGSVERAVLRRLENRVAAVKRKMAYMEAHHTSEWYHLSANKEADERGSRTSVSVSGLRESPTRPASAVLGEMVQIARSYFFRLHTPEPPSTLRASAQSTLISEVYSSYYDIPPPSTVVSGPFTIDETPSLKRAMHNTAPGPDGLPFSFWKSLHQHIVDHNKSSPSVQLRPFWETFIDMANDVRAFGSSRCRFKDANISLFYKKGDPTLTENYRPISSMNTDCKLYTNLLNNRLSPWAMVKIHPDQKGFIPGRLITEHTRLAYEVSHLADITGTRGFLVSLDQAKAYDRVDLRWLISVLRAMGIDPDLIARVRDLVSNCHSRVRINGGYSTKFSLRRGVRQGDPLSCLLFNFSIEPLAMRLRSVLKGLSVHGLPPVQSLFYADDVNLFLSPLDSVPEVVECLNKTSFAIGSKFNHSKTDVKPLGSVRFTTACFESQSLDGQILPGSYVLGPSDPLRVLGVWVGSTDSASARWSQLLSHIRSLIRQWNAIGASLPNRVLIAKALLLSRCYWLLDGNGVPRSVARRIDRSITHFVRGRFSSASSAIIRAPRIDGGAGCPSLTDRIIAYNLALLRDLLTGPQDALWRVWTTYDLTLSSSSSRNFNGPSLHPLTQKAHTRLDTLSDRLVQALYSARSVGIDTRCSFPSFPARLSYPILGHPALNIRKTVFNWRCLRSHGITTLSHLLSPPPFRCKKCSSKLTVLRKLFSSTPWDPLLPPLSDPAPLVRWPAPSSHLGAVRFLTAPLSILATAHHMLKPDHRLHMSLYAGHSLPRPVPLPFPSPMRDVNVWTDGSAVNNGLETCVAGAAWITDTFIHGSASLCGVPLTNNIAEVAAVLLALSAWPSCNLHIHTDSSFVIKLVSGSLVSLEWRGWPNFPWLGSNDNQRAPFTLIFLYTHFLFLLRTHRGSITFSWVKGHASDVFNNLADSLASSSASSSRVFDLSLFRSPPGFVDSPPILSGMPLSDITSHIVRFLVPAPVTSYVSSLTRDRWSFFWWRSFGLHLDFSLYAPLVWRVNVPAGLRDLLWKSMFGALPIGRSWHSKEDLGLDFCPCGSRTPLDLFHVFSGCSFFPILPLYADVLCPALDDAAPHSGAHISLDPERWWRQWWFPILCFKRLSHHDSNKRVRASLSRSVRRREWIYGSFLWALWKYRMKVAHEPSYLLTLPDITATMLSLFSSPSS